MALLARSDARTIDRRGSPGSTEPAIEERRSSPGAR
jgi:hypothetical protein